MERGKRAKRSEKNGKKSLLFLVIVIIIALLMIFIPKITNKKDNNKVDKSLLGLWTIDGNTDYEFSENGKGKLIVPLSEYPFSYKIEDNKLYIDFENEKSKDACYEFSFEGDKMIWKNTEEIGRTFTFTRK